MIEAPEKTFAAEELPPVDPEHRIDMIQQAVLNLHSIAKKLRAQRFSGGALRLDQVCFSRQMLFDLLLNDSRAVMTLTCSDCLFLSFKLQHSRFIFFVLVSAETLFYVGQRDHDAPRLLHLPVQR